MPATLKSSKSAATIKAIFQKEAQAALQDIGRYVQARAAKYPRQSPTTTYRRTGTLGRSVAVGGVQPTQGGWMVEVGTNIPYAKYLETGTGIFGPKKAPIKPKSGKFLAWTATRGAMKKAGIGGGVLVAAGLATRKGKLTRSAKHDTLMIFAKSVKGIPAWHFMENAFNGDKSRAYMGKRLNQAILRVKAEIG